ncbi:MAG: hypothetical protein J6Y85_00775 [Alphaproteobacteria bacterium]|nr:hypothetical protein [Alphaproteobacteria bacterium]
MKILLCLFLLACTAACSPKKPPLDDTQIVNGQSIIIPPEFNKIPQGETK